LIDNHRAVDPRSNQNASWSGREHGKAGGDSATATPTTLEDAILFLRIEVSQTVAQPIEDWNVGSLLTSAEQLQARARSTWQRGQVARLLDSIEELQALRRKHDLLQEEEEVSNEPRRLDENRLVQIAEPIRLASSNSENDTVAQLGRGEGNGFVTTAGGGAAERSSEDRRESFRAHYDAVGRIMRVHSSRRGTPPFSVLDEQGKLVHLLTPAPGLNVRRLERQRVGITGKITTIEIGGREFSHLMAEQVILLDRKSSGFPFNMAKLPWLLRATER
jgi:hypothetical protein